MAVRVFIVEDHDIVRESYVMLFELEPRLEVVGAVASAEEALEQIDAAAPDLVVIDISLPGMSGLELVERLRASHPELRLLVVTGHDESRYAQASARAGADGFVKKGSADRILEAIARLTP